MRRLYSLPRKNALGRYRFAIAVLHDRLAGLAGFQNNNSVQRQTETLKDDECRFRINTIPGRMSSCANNHTTPSGGIAFAQQLPHAADFATGGMIAEETLRFSSLKRLP
jgi:hypothetical protein